MNRCAGWLKDPAAPIKQQDSNTMKESQKEFPFLSRRDFLRQTAILALGGAAGGPIHTSARFAETPGPGTLKGQWQKRVPLRQGVFSIAMGNQIMRAPSETGRPEGSSFLLHHLAALSPPILRLPGGDMLNSWSWISGCRLENRNGRPMRVKDFAEICRAGQAVPLWGVDAAGAPPDDTGFLARAIAEQGAQSKYFELGNELYLSKWRSIAPNADVYAQKAARHAQVLKKQFPQTKCGVPVASYRNLMSVSSNGRPARGSTGRFAWKTPEELDPWILKLARKRNFYDAIVLHLYLVPRELGRNGLAEHTPDEVCRWAWIRSDARQLQDLFGLAHQVFPDKEIWVTEWAFNATQYIGGARGGNKDVRYQVHQTMLAVLYNARFMLNIAYYVPWVPVMTFWTLYGQATTDLLDGNRTTINYEMFRLLRWAREGNDEITRLALANAPVLKGPAGPQGFDRWESAGVDVFGFHQDQRLQSVAVLNALPGPVSVEIPNLPATGFKDGRALCSKEMLPDWGNPDNPTFAKWRPPYSFRKIGNTGKVVTVPPNSLSVLHTNKAFG